MDYFRNTLKYGAFALAAALTACGGGGGGGLADAISSPVTVTLAEVTGTAAAGGSFLVSGTAVSQPNQMTEASWRVSKLTAGAPDLVMSNGDCATATKSGRTINSITQSTWTCDAVVTVPAEVAQDSTYRLVFSGVDAKGNAGTDFREVKILAARKNYSSLVTASVAQVTGIAAAGSSLSANGTAVSATSLMAAARWSVAKLTAGAPDLTISNSDCSTGSKTNSATQSSWTCNAVVTLPPSLVQDSTYRLIFSATDDKGNANADSRDFTIAATRAPAASVPVASTQPMLTVTSGDMVGLNCFASGGTLGAGSSYRIQWAVKTNASGLPVNFDANAAGDLSFKAPAVTSPSSVTFQCRATDDNLATAVSDSVVTINPTAPGAVTAVAVTGPAQSATPQALVTLDGSQSTIQGGGTLSFTWTQTEGPAVSLAGANTAKPTFVAPQVASSTRLVFKLTARASTGDGGAATASETAEAVVYVAPLAPLTLSISSAQATIGGRPVIMSVTATPAITTLYYEWTQLTGPAVTLGGANTNVASFVSPTVGGNTELRFSVKVARKPIAQAAPNEIGTTDIVIAVTP